MADISTIAREARNFFEQAKRPDDGEFWRTKDILTTPEWVQRLVREAHGDRLPNDWTYKAIVEVLDAIEDFEHYGDSLDDARHEIVDGLVDIYTADLTGWLHENVYNVYYLNEAIDRFGPVDDGFRLLSMAQFVAYDEIFSDVLTALETEAESREDDE